MTDCKKQKSVNKRNLKRSLTLTSVFWFLVFILPAVKFYAVQLNSILDLIFDIWGVASFFILTLIVIHKDIKLPKGFLPLILFWIVYIFSTLIHSGTTAISGAISEICRLMIIPLYLIIINSKGECTFNSGLSKLRILYIVILFFDSLITIIECLGFTIFEYGSICSLLGLDNYAIFYVLPMLSVILFVSQKLNGKLLKLDILIFALCYVSKLITLAVTGIFALTAMLFVILLFKYCKFLKRRLSLKVLFVLLVLLVFGVILFQIQRVFAPLFNLFGKDVTMSYRTIIWDKTFNAILNKPFLGYGKILDKNFQVTVGLSPIVDVQANHPHNYILALLYSTGLVGFFLFISMLFVAFGKVGKNIQRNDCLFLFSGILGFMVLMFTDDYITIPAFYVMLTISLLLKKEKSSKYGK